MGDGVIKAYLEPKDQITSSPVLVNQIRLMMAVDSMRAYFRWFQKTKDDESNLGKHDAMIALMAMSGWAWECIDTMKKASKSGKGKWLSRNMIDKDDKKTLSAWDKYVAGDSSCELIKRLQRIRNKCFAHWDPKSARDCIERLGAQGDELPFVESPDGVFMSTRYPWVKEVIAGELLGVKPGDTEKPDFADKVAPIVEEIGETIGSLADLMTSMAAAMLKKSGLNLVERNA